MNHGTSVAGVAAAGYVPGGPMIGVAPEAELGVYKVRRPDMRMSEQSHELSEIYMCFIYMCLYMCVIYMCVMYM